MSVKGLAQGLLRAAQRLLDTDGDGKVELSDLPGAVEKAAQVASAGEAMMLAGRTAINALLALARAGSLQENGVTLTEADVYGRWQAARKGFVDAADRIREELAKEIDSATPEQ